MGVSGPELRVQPRPRGFPVPLRRSFRYVQNQADFVKRHPPEELHLNDLRLPFIQLRQPLQRLVDRQRLDALIFARPLFCAAFARA